jgi:putative membrane protein
MPTPNLSWFFGPKLAVTRPLLLRLAFIAACGALGAKLRIWIPYEFKGLGAEASAVGAFALTFLIGFRNSTAYDRWWEGRKTWGILSNNLRNFCLKFVTWFQTTQEERQECHRLVSGFAIALRDHLRDSAELSKLPGFSADTARPTHVPAYLAKEIQQLLISIGPERRRDPYALVIMDPHIKSLMEACGACERIKSTPLSTSYRALLRHGLFYYLAFASIFVIWDLGLVALPAVLIPAYFLIGIELAAESVEEPFGQEGDDLPIDSLCLSISRTTGEILGVDTAISDPAAHRGQPESNPAPPRTHQNR